MAPSGSPAAPRQLLPTQAHPSPAAPTAAALRFGPSRSAICIRSLRPGLPCPLGGFDVLLGASASAPVAGPTPEADPPTLLCAR